MCRRHLFNGAVLAFLISAAECLTVLESLGYVNTTDVSHELMLALDISAMRAAHNDFTAKKSIYEDGSSSNTGDLSLQSLSLDSESNWREYPMYNIYRAGFDLLGQTVEGDDPGFFDGEPISEYANTLVNDLFLLNVTNIEAEAALAVNVAMAFYGSLYDMLKFCKVNDKQQMHRGLDRAAAYWVGEGQVRGDSTTGYFFYNMAQLVGERFNQYGNDDSEVMLNTNMITELLLLQADINDNKCSTPSGFVQMRAKVKNMVSYLNQVLVQMLLYRIETYPKGQPTDFVELYSLALLPQIAACNSDLFSTVLKYTVRLNVSPKTEPNLIEALQKSYSCLGLTCQQVGAYQVNGIPQCDDSAIEHMAGYNPSTDQRLIARIDRDIRQIRWFMQFSAVEAAREYYTYGWNTFFSLQDLAKGETTQQVSDEFVRTASYFSASNSNSFADDMIQQVLAKTGDFASATEEEQQSYLDSLLRGVVMYLGVTSELKEAVTLASGAGTIEDAQKAWDAGAALFFGSTEGEHAGGAKNSQGESVYGLANKLCGDFNVCGATKRLSSISQNIFAALVAGNEALKNQDLTGLQDAFNEDITPLLIVPVIQGMLGNVIEAGVIAADPNENGPEKGFAYGYSRAVIGYFSDLDKSDVDAIKTAILTPSAANTDEVFSRMEDLLDHAAATTQCEDVGATKGSDDVPRGVCKGVTPDLPDGPDATDAPNFAPVPTPAPVPVTRPPVTEKPVSPGDQAQGIAWGRFNFNNNDLANLEAGVARDVKKMWAAKDLNASETIYLNGENFLQGLFDMNSVDSLSKMSTLANETMANDAIYNFYRYALYEDNLLGDPVADRDVWDFANDVVTLALSPDNGNSPVLAAEATVVFHTFFIILRQLNQAARECKSGGTLAQSFLDSAVAIWIGHEQGMGKYNSGYMMYSMAQLAMNHFQVPEAEAPVNTKLMDTFNEAQTVLQGCANDADGSFAIMRLKVKEIAKLLTIPMVQELLYYMSVGNKNFEEMFAVAFVPHLAACSAGDYQYLQSKLFSGSFFTDSPDDQIVVLEELSAGLSCLGITCSDLGDISNSDFSQLKSTVSRICKNLEVQQNATYLAGYATGSNVGEEARLDLDIHQIDILMRTKAVQTAKEFYEYGYNSREGEGFRTLKKLAADSSVPAIGELAEDFNDYYSSANYPDAYINQVFAGTGAYQTASRAQKAEAIRRMLQAGVTYLGIHAKIEQAQDACENGQQGENLVDSAAALFVGSIEGTRSGGSRTNSGTMLMALGKEVCGAFDKCEAGGDATANEFILFAFADMKQWLSTKDCDSSTSIKDESLLPILSVSIIQAVLRDADLSEPLSAESDDDKLAALDALAKSILPQVAAANATSAATINSNTDFNSAAKAVSSGTAALFNAFTYVVRQMGVDCDIIGTLKSTELSVCDTEAVAPHPETPTTLGKNTSIYKSTTYVQNLADIALDVKQMEDDLMLNRKDLAELLYKEGQNSPVYDKYGIKTDVRSLSSFSTDAAETMRQNPLFQTTVFALQDDAGMYLGKPATQYADTIVQESFEKPSPSTLAAEAAVVLNLWMEVANELYRAVDLCKNQQVHDDDGIHSMDEVAAYWIGDGEAAGNANEGHLLYNLAERMAIKFGTMDSSGQATSNLKFLRLLNQARLDLSFPESCSDDLTTARKLQRTVTRIVAQMLVVHVQALINGILSNDRDRVRVHAHGFVPLVKACRTNTFDYLNDKLIVDTYSETEIDALVGQIYAALPCFEVTCADIGTHQETETGAVCEDPPFRPPMAGFRPEVDVVDYAALDLDIKLIEILMAQKAYGVAKDVYMFGKHSAAGGADGTTSLSLQSLAKSTRRPGVPEYNAFVQYFASDNNYADTIILEALDSQTEFADRRAATVVGGSQLLVMYMGVQEQMYESVRECKAGSRQAAAELLWNKAAAFIIGSMEGTMNEPFSQREGLFLWGVAKKHCAEWGTCRNIITGSTLVNERILSLLYTGQGAVKANSCEALEKAANEMTPLLRVPLMQTVLTEVVEMSKHKAGPIRDMHHARAYIAAESLLPLIEDFDRDTAAMIKSNLDFLGDALSDGRSAVVQGFVNSMRQLEIDCLLVGNTNEVNTCTGEVSDSDSNRMPLVIGLGLGVIVGGSIAVMLFLWQSKKRGQATPEQPKFVRNQRGVMDEADREFTTSESRKATTTDDMDEGDASNAEAEDFMDVELPEAV